MTLFSRCAEGCACPPGLTLDEEGKKQLVQELYPLALALWDVYNFMLTEEMTLCQACKPDQLQETVSSHRRALAFEEK